MRIVIVSDTHGDMIDADAESAFFSFLDDYHADMRIHLGDVFDFRCLRRKASDEERREGFRADVEAGCSFMRRFKPNRWLRGNHDERLYDLIEQDDEKLADLAGYIANDIRDAIGPDCVVLPYDKRKGVMRLGDTLLMHGYGHGIGATRQHVLAYGMSVIHGHTHTMDVAAVPGLDVRRGYGAGCLCKYDMNYNRASLNTLRQEHGFITAELKGDRLLVQQVRI